MDLKARRRSSRPLLTGLQHQEREALFLVTRIRSFEAQVAAKALPELGQLVSRYYALVAQAVLDNDGDVDGFMGPEILSLFGIFCPFDEATIAKVIGSLLESDEYLRGKFDASLEGGICYGVALFGSFGVSRRAVTAIGEPSICASELARGSEALRICERAAAHLGLDESSLPAGVSIAAHSRGGAAGG